MEFYKSIKEALSKADATMKAKNSSFKIFEVFLKNFNKGENGIWTYFTDIYFSEDENSLIFDYFEINMNTGMMQLGNVGKLTFDSSKKEWYDSVVVFSMGLNRKRPKKEQIFWSQALEDEELLKESGIDVYEGYLSYPDGEEKITLQSQYLLDIEFIKEFTHIPHFVRFFLKNGTHYPKYILGYENLYYLFMEKDDGSKTIIATISCGTETNRIYSSGLEIVPYYN